jgi:putative ABC transport system substrate-binding protein
VNRRAACIALSLLPVAAATRLHAQPAGTLHIAWVSTDRSDVPSPFLAALRNGLRELGYVEGRNLVIDQWYGDGYAEPLTRRAGEILRARPEMIVTQGAAFGAMRSADVRIPIVFSMSANPVAAGVIGSYARPGGNATGISLFDFEPLGKRMEFLRELKPATKRIAVLANPQHPGEQMELQAARAIATQAGLQMRYFPVRTNDELEKAFADIAIAKDDAIASFADAFMMNAAGSIASFSRQQRIPAVSGWAIFAKRGNVMSYGPVIEECYRRLASYVDRIHRGANPGELPVEQPTKLELVINQNAAKAIGLAIPSALLARADEVIA